MELPEFEVYVEDKDGESWRNVCVAIKDNGEIWHTDLKIYRKEEDRKKIAEDIVEAFRRCNRYPKMEKALENIKTACFDAMEGAGMPEFGNYESMMVAADEALND